jgi:hypothetical protein
MDLLFQLYTYVYVMFEKIKSHHLRAIIYQSTFIQNLSKNYYNSVKIYYDFMIFT